MNEKTINSLVNQYGDRWILRDLDFFPEKSSDMCRAYPYSVRTFMDVVRGNGFVSFNTCSACSSEATFTPLFSVPIISPMSFPITAGFTSIAPTISAPFSYTYLIVYTLIFPVPYWTTLIFLSIKNPLLSFV